MDYESQLKALESRLFAVIETRDRIMHEALEKFNLRLEKHHERIKDILERLRELEEKVEALDLKKLDELDAREVKSREERAFIFDQFLQDQERLIQQASDCGESDGLEAHLKLMATRLAEVERIVRSQIR